MKIAVLERDSVTVGDVDFSYLESVADITYYGRIEKEKVIDVVREYDGIIVNKTVIDENVIKSCPNLRYVGLFATGYNNIDVKCAAEHNITVCNVPSYSTDAVAQHVFSFILYCASSLGKYISSVNAGDYKKCKSFCYYPFPIEELKGKTLGILGYGSIGKRVAEIASVFGMNIIVYSRRNNCAPYKYVTIDELFRQSDYLTVHCPLNAETDKIVNAEMLSLMKENAVLINTARGGVVDENALADALKGGKIRAACVDTITKEPMSEDCALFGIENCYITPHIAWAAKQTRQRLVNIAAENIRAFLNGNPQNKVN
jgi:glycerate dehydrogenase